MSTFLLATQREDESMKNHFEDLEDEVREYLTDPEIRTKALEDLAQEILRQMVRQAFQDNNDGNWAPATVRHVRLTPAVVTGVASVIADELGKNALESMEKVNENLGKIKEIYARRFR